jgi:hypothetical protein
MKGKCIKLGPADIKKIKKKAAKIGVYGETHMHGMLMKIGVDFNTTTITCCQISIIAMLLQYVSDAEVWVGYGPALSRFFDLDTKRFLVAVVGGAFQSGMAVILADGQKYRFLLPGGELISITQMDAKEVLYTSIGR